MHVAEHERPDPKLDAMSAEVGVLAAVPSWWARRAQLVGLPQEWQDWRRALPPPPLALPHYAGGALTRASGFALGEAYVCALSAADRYRFGRHYTPKPLADALWTEVERTRIAVGDGATVDHASGAGALLIPPLRRFVADQRDADPALALAAVASRFGGIDNDELAVWLGNAILAAELLPLWASVPEREREPMPRLLCCGDGLDVERGSASVVVMNPPFGRAPLGEQDRQRWSRSLYGHANWYGVFLHAAVERVRPGGLVAAVLPASFLGGAYYQRLRSYLAAEAPLVRLRLIDDRSGVFASGVLQETCLAVFHRGGRQREVTCSTQRINGTVRSVSLGRAVLDSRAPDLPWLLPRMLDDSALVRAASRYALRLSHYGWKASTGPLVWNRHKPQISGNETEGAVPILWAADVDRGRVERSPARDAQRWLRLRDKDAFMRLSAPAVLVQRTTAPEQPRRLAAAELTAETLSAWGGAVVVENHVNVLRCTTPNGALSPSLLAALLNSAVFDRLFRCLTGTVAVSAYELEALPLPGPDMIEEWAKLPSAELEAAIAAAFA
jgi:adenine-specific DNA-methyltransferase